MRPEGHFTGTAVCYAKGEAVIKVVAGTSGPILVDSETGITMQVQQKELEWFISALTQHLEPGYKNTDF